jgi:CRP-like cAMP-binding protein
VLERLPQWFAWVRDAEHARRVGILGRTPVFAGLPRRLLARLAVRLFEKAYAPGEVVFSEGDPGKGLFVVLDGEIEIVRETAQGAQRLATFGPGTAFGELALIDDLPRSASAVATAPTRLLILYRTHFEDLVVRDRAVAILVMRNLLRLLAGYVRAANVPRGKLADSAKLDSAPAPAGDGAPNAAAR